MLQTEAVIEVVPQWFSLKLVWRATKSLFYLSSKERNKCNEVHLMTFGAQEAKKNASCDKQRKSIKYSIYDSRFFLKGNYEYDHNSIRIDTEQDGFLWMQEKVARLRRYKCFLYISNVLCFAYSIYVKNTTTHNLLDHIVHWTLLHKYSSYYLMLFLNRLNFCIIMHSTNKWLKIFK